MSLLDDFPFIEQHPPERGARRNRPVVLYSCCCCCCCCLHTLGGAIGAVLAGRPGAKSELQTDKVFNDRPAKGQWLYWSSFLITVSLGMAIACGVILVDRPSYRPLERVLEMAVGVLLSAVIGGPLWLLGAGVVMAMRIPIQTDPTERSGYWRQLGWITVGIIAGTLAGLLAMVVIFVFMSSL